MFQKHSTAFEPFEMTRLLCRLKMLRGKYDKCRQVSEIHIFVLSVYLLLKKILINEVEIMGVKIKSDSYIKQIKIFLFYCE